MGDFVWNCGNSQVMEYVQTLVSDNAALKRQSLAAMEDAQERRGMGDMLGSQTEAAAFSFPLSSALFDTTEVNADRALAFLSAIGDNDGHQIPSLLTLLVDHAGNPQICLKVCAALENLTFTDTENRRTIVKMDGVEKILQVMEQQ